MIVTELLVAAMMPLIVPPNVPVPVPLLSVRVTSVASARGAGSLLSFCACTVTLKPVPAVGDAGSTEVITRCGGVGPPVDSDKVWPETWNWFKWPALQPRGYSHR